MHFESWAWLTVAGGFLLGCWRYLQTWAWRAIGLVINRAALDGPAGDAFMCHCWKNLKRSPFGERRYQGNDIFVRPVSRYQKVAFEKIGGDLIVFWDGWKPIFV